MGRVTDGKLSREGNDLRLKMTRPVVLPDDRTEFVHRIFVIDELNASHSGSSSKSAGPRRLLERILTGLVLAFCLAFAVSFLAFGYAAFRGSPELVDVAGFWLTRIGFVLVAGFAVSAIFSNPDK